MVTAAQALLVSGKRECCSSWFVSRGSLGEVVVRTTIEALLKRRFYVVHLVLLALAALLLANAVTTVGAYVAGRRLFETLNGASDKKVARAPTRGPGNRDFEGIADANIFEGKREQLVAGDTPIAETPQPTGDDCTDSPKSSLRLRLVGTAVFSDPEFSLASIVDEGKGGGAEMYSINDCVNRTVDPLDPDSKLQPPAPPCTSIGDSAHLRRIEAERVCIWNDSDAHMEYLALNEPPEKGGVVATKVEKKPEGGEDDVGKDIRKVSENSYEVGQGEVDRALNNLSELATQARVVPAFEGGKTIGFKLFSIRPGSLYSKIGLQNGDVITRINGYEMSSPEKGLEIYGKLKDSKQVTVDMKRRGKPMTLDYNITQ